MKNTEKTKAMPSQPVYIDIPDPSIAETTPVYMAQAINGVHFNTPYNIDPELSTGEINTMPSMTIPNETYTIRELLEKHTRGVLPEVSNQAIWGEEDQDFDSPDLQQIHQMDLYDVQEHLNKTKTLIEQLDKNFKSQQHLASQTAEQKNESEAKVRSDAESEQK